MENADNTDSVGMQPINDDMRACQIGPVCRRQIVSLPPGLWTSGDGLKCAVDDVLVHQQLRLPPGFSGVLQDVDNILRGLS